MRHGERDRFATVKVPDPGLATADAVLLGTKESRERRRPLIRGADDGATSVGAQRRTLDVVGREKARYGHQPGRVAQIGPQSNAVLVLVFAEAILTTQRPRKVEKPRIEVAGVNLAVSCDNVHLLQSATSSLG